MYPSLHAENNKEFTLADIKKNEKQWNDCLEQIKFFYKEKSSSLMSIFYTNLTLIVALVLAGIAATMFVRLACTSFQEKEAPILQKYSVWGGKKNKAAVFSAIVGLVISLAAFYGGWKGVSAYLWLGITYPLQVTRIGNDKLHALTEFVKRLDTYHLNDVEPLKQIFKTMQEKLKLEGCLGIYDGQFADLFYDKLIV